MSVSSIPTTGAAPNWYCTRCEMGFLDPSGTKPCPRCKLDDALIEPPAKTAPSKPSKLAKPGARPGAMIKRETLARSRGAVERISAWGVLLISFAGTVAALHGGWAPLLAAPRIGGIVGGFTLQAILTYAQWAYYDNRPLCWGSRVIDTILTATGYGALILAPLARFWTGIGVDSEINGWPGAVLAAWAVIYAISFLLAWYPESRLVD